MNILVLASVIGAFAGGTDVPTFKRTEKVERWLDEVEDEIEKAGLVEEIDPVTVLALIHVESYGDPYARKFRGSQFYGMLQMGTGASKDIGHRNAKHLHGEPQRAIRDFLAYLVRYESRHAWNPEHIAIIWKGGPGTLKRWQKFERDNRAFRPFFPWQNRVPIYYGRFQRAFEVWDSVFNSQVAA